MIKDQGINFRNLQLIIELFVGGIDKTYTCVFHFLSHVIFPFSVTYKRLEKTYMGHHIILKLI